MFRYIEGYVQKVNPQKAPQVRPMRERYSHHRHSVWHA